MKIVPHANGCSGIFTHKSSCDIPPKDPESKIIANNSFSMQITNRGIVAYIYATKPPQTDFGAQGTRSNHPIVSDVDIAFGMVLQDIDISATSHRITHQVTRTDRIYRFCRSHNQVRFFRLDTGFLDKNFTTSIGIRTGNKRHLSQNSARINHASGGLHFCRHHIVFGININRSIILFTRNISNKPTHAGFGIQIIRFAMPSRRNINRIVRQRNLAP